MLQDYDCGQKKCGNAVENGYSVSDERPGINSMLQIISKCSVGKKTVGPRINPGRTVDA